ncbi:MAG: citrate/2-methylcitrate synthase [Xanthobacteraceae bacterium]
MTETNEPIKIHRGLRGVYFDRSPCTFIDGRIGELRYRGYSIHDLAEHSTFEETAWLLLRGELPTKAELAEFDRELKAARELPAPILAIIRAITSAHPMDVLRTAVSALSAFDPQTSDNSREAVIRKGIRLTSQVPMIVAAHARLREGFEPIAANKELSHAASLLWMLKGATPSVDAAQLIDRDLVLHAEHGSNASSFAARVVTGTEANLHAAVTAAIAALSGPAHGGAAEDVMKMAEEIGDPARAADYVRDKRKAGEAVTGFGHRVYRAEDPRARHMRAGVERLSKEMGQPRWYEILQAVVKAMAPYARHGVNVNVDFYSGVVYHLLGIKRDLFVPIFAIGRVPGWVLQALEQSENNILIRPLTLYSGPDARSYLAMENRASTASTG